MKAAEILRSLVDLLDKVDCEELNNYEAEDGYFKYQYWFKKREDREKICHYLYISYLSFSH